MICPFWVGFCRSEGLAAAYDDAAVHEAGIGHKETVATLRKPGARPGFQWQQAGI
jgi:hypothetical protein